MSVEKSRIFFGFLKNSFFSIVLLAIGGTFFGLLAKNFRQGCHNCFLRVHGNKMRKYLYLLSRNHSKKINSSVTGQKTFVLSSKRFPLGCRNCFLYAIGQFWRNFCSFLLFSGAWLTNLRLFGKKNQAGLSKLLFTCPMEHSEKNLVFLRIFNFFKRLFFEKNSACCWNVSGRVVKTAF